MDDQRLTSSVDREQRSDPEAPRYAVLDRRVSRRDVLRFLGLSAVSGAILAACGASATPSPSVVSAAPPSAAPATAAPATAAPTPVPSTAASAPAASGGAVGTGTIRAGSYEGGAVFSWMTWNNFGQDFAWNWSAQRLLSVAPDGTVLYDLAKAHEVSADGKTYTFHLVQDAVWHDGKPVTADDVVFTYNTSLKSKAMSAIVAKVKPFTGSGDVIADESKSASGIVAVDPYTVKFLLDQPNAAIMSTTFGSIWISPKHPYDGVALADYAKTDIATNLFIGSGPYKMVQFNPKAFVNFEAYPAYSNGTGFKGAPGAAKVSIRIYADDQAQLLSTTSGEVDFQYFRKPSGDQLKQLNAISTMHSEKSLVGYNIFFSFNLLNPSTPLLKDKRVRQAFVLCMDRHTLIDDVLGGVYNYPKYMNDWIAPWANSTKLNSYDQDIAQAKSLLAAAGWDPSVVLNVRNYPPKLTDDVPVIVEQWKAVGINVKLTPLPDDTFVNDFYRQSKDTGTTDSGPLYDVAFVYGYGSLDGTPYGQDAELGCASIWPNGSNSMRWCSQEWDTEFAAALKGITQADQAPHFQRCSEIFNDELPYVPMYDRVDYSIIGNTLKGPEKATILHPSAGGVRWWEWTIS